MINFDYHTHTKYSHGKGTILQNAISAKEKGLSGICISDHGAAHPIFGIRSRYLDKMKQECQQASRQTGIEVLLGVEANVLGISGKIDVKEQDYDKFDCLLAGIHRFILYDGIPEWLSLGAGNMFSQMSKKGPSQKLKERNTKVYINCIKNNPIDIITHLNYLVFSNAVEVAKCCEDYGTYIEINTKKVHLSDQEWQDLVDKTNVNFVINSDAHSTDRVGDDKLAKELLQRVNIPLERIKNINGNKPNFLRFADFKEKL